MGDWCGGWSVREGGWVGWSVKEGGWGEWWCNVWTVRVDTVTD